MITEPEPAILYFKTPKALGPQFQSFTSNSGRADRLAIGFIAVFILRRFFIVIFSFLFAVDIFFDEPISPLQYCIQT